MMMIKYLICLCFKKRHSFLSLLVILLLMRKCYLLLDEEEREQSTLITTEIIKHRNELAFVADSHERITSPRCVLDSSESIESTRRGAPLILGLHASARGSARGAYIYIPIYKVGQVGCNVAFQYLRAEIFTKSHRGRRIRGG